MKHILITGCSTGIGYTCAHGLQKLGYSVFATCRRDEDVKRLQDEGLNAFKLDLCDTNSMHESLTWMLSQTGGRMILRTSSRIRHSLSRQGCHFLFGIGHPSPCFFTVFPPLIHSAFHLGHHQLRFFAVLAPPVGN
jgi:NAD(P)-dependent dehydrogenase (short-subunit alcohol dehydrogenase family)